MSDDTPSISIPSSLAPSSEPLGSGDNLFTLAMKKILRKCRDPSNETFFLPNLLVDGPVQPLRAEEWTVPNLGPSVTGSGSICDETSPGGSGKPNPNKDITFRMKHLYINGLANVKPTSWDVKPKGSSKDSAAVTVEFGAFSETHLPEGVDSNLVIRTEKDRGQFIIKQPCKPDPLTDAQNSTSGAWTATGKGTFKVTLKRATGHAKMVFYTTSDDSGMKLHANVKEINFRIPGVNDGRSVTEAADSTNPNVSAEVDVTNIHKDRESWNRYIKRTLTSGTALKLFQSRLNVVLGGEDAKDHLAHILIKKMNEIIKNA